MLSRPSLQTASNIRTPFGMFDVVNASTMPHPLSHREFAGSPYGLRQILSIDRQNVCLKGAAFQTPEQTPDGPLPAQVPLP